MRDVIIGLHEPTTAEEIKAVQTLDGIRAAIEKGQHHSPLIYECLVTARHMGLKGEDVYAFLAYRALVRLQHTHEQLMKTLSYSTVPGTFEVLRG